MDPEIRELKELVRNSIALSEDTNRIVHSMRNTARWGAVMRVVWWVVILGFSFVLYAYFAPYLEQVMALYGSAQDVLQNFRPQQ